MLMALTAVAVMACRVSSVPAGHDGDGTGEPAQGELGLRGERVVQGEGGWHALSPMSGFFCFDTVPYGTLQRTVRYSKMLIECNRKV